MRGEGASARRKGEGRGELQGCDASSDGMALPCPLCGAALKAGVGAQRGGGGVTAVTGLGKLACSSSKAMSGSAAGKAALTSGAREATRLRAWVNGVRAPRG